MLRKMFFGCVMIIMALTADAQLKVVGYMYTTGDANAVDWSKITHLNLAFENPDAQGNLSFTTNNNTLIQKAHANDVKVLVSICGGGVSNDAAMRARYFNLISDANRAVFVEKIVQYLDDHDFDGIDLDLEGPAINSDYNKFVADLDAALPEGILLTAALSHLNNGDMVSSTSVQIFDFLNIMAYDATGPWNPGSPGQHSSYELATSSLAWWVDNKGLSKDKAILGVPFYGYGFGVDANEGISFAAILSRFGAGSENRDESGNKIYYNGIPTIRKKVKYVVDENFGGIMIWQLAQDVVTSNPKSLLRNIYEELYGVMAIEKEGVSVFSISPNPASALIKINVADETFRNAQVRISDSQGRVFPLTFYSENVIDVSVLSPGMYLLHLEMDRSSSVQAFIKP